MQITVDWPPCTWLIIARRDFDSIIYVHMDSLNKTRNLFHIKVDEEKNAEIRDISWVNRIYLTVLLSVENIYVCCITSLHSREIM